jgi:polar amino acid transport system substrate-binding protein
MRVTSELAMGLIACLLSGCASTQTAPGPEAKQALAPTGKLRVAFLATAPTHAIENPATGELKGPAVDLGREMARRIGVPFEPIPYTSFPPVLAGAKSGDWDIAMMGVSVEREQHVDFTSPYMVVEFGFLIPGGSSISAVADVDRPGVRVGVLEKSSPDTYLSRTLRNASIIRLPTLGAVIQDLRNGKVDAIYATKATVLAQSMELSGSRVLEGRFGGEETALAVPKGRKLAASYAQQFVEAVKSEGLVKSAIEKAGLRGVVVAPAEVTSAATK